MPEVRSIYIATLKAEVDRIGTGATGEKVFVDLARYPRGVRAD